MPTQREIGNLAAIVLKESLALRPLSALLPKVLRLAKVSENLELVTWAQLETQGYYSTNLAFMGEGTIPGYRAVTGTYIDSFRRAIRIHASEYAFVNDHRLRNGVAELEAFARSARPSTVVDPEFIPLLQQRFSQLVHGYRFQPSAVENVLASIRGELISRLSEYELPTEVLTAEPSLALLHPKVQEAAGALFSSGHYRNAILDTYIALIHAVKVKANRPDLDGSRLMGIVFSPDSPILQMAADPDEQRGFLHLYMGAVMGIRNPKAHQVVDQTDAQRTFEWLAFASVLFRKLEEATLIIPPSS